MMKHFWLTNKEAVERFRVKKYFEALDEFSQSLDRLNAYLAPEYIRKETLKAWGALRENRNVCYDERGKTWRPTTKKVPKTI